MEKPSYQDVIDYLKNFRDSDILRLSQFGKDVFDIAIKAVEKQMNESNSNSV